MKMYLAPYRQRRHIHTSPANRYHGTSHCDVHVPLNVKVEKDAFVVDLIIPGLKAEEIEIEIAENIVDIKGEFPKLAEDAKYLRYEHPKGHFHRRIKLPTLLDLETAEAKLEQGILSLRIPKAEEAKPRTIKVKTK